MIVEQIKTKSKMKQLTELPECFAIYRQVGNSLWNKYIK